MRRSKVNKLVAIAFTIAVAGCGGRSIEDFAPMAAGAQPVNIRVMCPTATNISISVNPNRVRAHRGRDTVAWSVTGNGTQATITPKINGFWPFATTTFVVTQGQPTDSGDVTSGAGAYPYQIVALCQVPGNGPLITLTLDPDVIITED